MKTYLQRLSIVFAVLAYFFFAGLTAGYHTKYADKRDCRVYKDPYDKYREYCDGAPRWIVGVTWPISMPFMVAYYGTKEDGK